MTALLNSGYSSVDSVLKLIGLLILCAIIIAASYFVTRFIGKKQTGMTGDSNFKSLDVYRISQNKYLQLLEIGSRYFVIAVCKDTVTLIGELQKEDITYWREEGKKVSFKEILSRVQAPKADPAGSPEDTSPKDEKEAPMQENNK